MPVYLADGRRLGRTVEVGHGLDWLHVEQGRWLVHDWYIPISAVRDVTTEGVFLDVNLAALRACKWNVPPIDYLLRQGATPGYEYTSVESIPDFGEPERPEQFGELPGVVDVIDDTAVDPQMNP
jgi:hypothetical protein